MKTLRDYHLAGKRLVIREDFNVPMHAGEVRDPTRIEAALPTIRYAIAQGAKVILLSHLGRPQEGVFDKKYSLLPVADRLSQYLEQPVIFVKDCLEDIKLENGQVALCENTRFLQGESENDPELAKKLAAQADLFVMDAFAVAHRTQASTVGIAQYAPAACLGFLVEKELSALDKIFMDPQRPLLGIVGGSKISTKLQLLKSLLEKVDILMLGGGIANTFLLAKGYSVGCSLVEKHLIETAKDLLRTFENKILLPIDAMVAAESLSTAVSRELDAIEKTDQILDIGPKTLSFFEEKIQTAATILWNGPVGAFEQPAFSAGTLGIANAMGAARAYTVVGGGDSIAALTQAKQIDTIDYLSTAGGAFLKYLEGAVLPGLRGLI